MSDPLGKEPRAYETDHKLVNDFASDMFEKLRKNAHKAHWNTVDQSWLLGRLKVEVEELSNAINHTPSEIIQECADVANFAAMIADNARKACNQYGRHLDSTVKEID